MSRANLQIPDSLIISRAIPGILFIRTSPAFCRRPFAELVFFKIELLTSPRLNGSAVLYYPDYQVSSKERLSSKEADTQTLPGLLSETPGNTQIDGSRCSRKTHIASFMRRGIPIAVVSSSNTGIAASRIPA
jgi:hypothetical protein